MPYSRKLIIRKPKNYRRKIYRFKVSRPVRSTYRPREKGKNVFPTKKFVKLSLYTLPSVTSTTGSFGSLSNRFNINNPRDPAGAGGTSQPRYFDTLFGADDTTAIYKSGHCYGCKVEAYFVNAEKIGDVGICCYGDDTTAPSSFQELGERAYASQKVIEPAGGTRTVVKFSRYFNFPKMIGVSKKAYLDDDEYMFTSTSNPPTMFNLQCYFQAYGAQTSSVNIKLRLTFYVKCEELADVATSS